MLAQDLSITVISVFAALIAGLGLLIWSGQRQILRVLGCSKHLGGLLAHLARAWYHFSLLFFYFSQISEVLTLVLISKTNLTQIYSLSDLDLGFPFVDLTLFPLSLSSQTRSNILLTHLLDISFLNSLALVSSYLKVQIAWISAACHRSIFISTV